jgi:hypothetical protein
MEKERRDEAKKVFHYDSLIEKVLSHYRFEKDKLKLIDLYFFKGRTIVRTCMEVGICRATFFNWTNEILEIAYKWAIELGILKER